MLELLIMASKVIVFNKEINLPISTDNKEKILSYLREVYPDIYEKLSKIGDFEIVFEDDTAIIIRKDAILG